MTVALRFGMQVEEPRGTGHAPCEEPNVTTMKDVATNTWISERRARRLRPGDGQDDEN
jgi:hypothetical protein